MKLLGCMLIAMSVSSSSVLAFAQPAPLTLPQAQAEAREHAPERATADAGLAAARERAAVAGRRFTRDPIAIGRYQQQPPGADADDRTWSVGLEWTLDLSGSWRPRRESARAIVGAADFVRASTLLDLDSEVALALADVADGQRRAARAAQMVALRELASRAADRIRATGGGTQLEVDAAKLDLRSAQIDVATARGDLEASRVRLGRLLGRRDAAGLSVSDELDRTPAPAVLSVESLVERDTRVRALVAELDAARHAVTAERKAARPDVTIGLEVGRARQDIPAGAFATDPTLTGTWNEWELAIQLSVPLPLVDRNRIARANASADVLGIEARLARVRADVRASIVAVHVRLAAAIDGITVAADIPEIIDREVQLLDKGLRAGGIEFSAWAPQAHRLVEVGRSYDEAALALRRARAAWARLAIR